MEKYIDGLYARLEELADKPLTLGRIEEADAVAGLLCRLHELDGHSPEPHSRMVRGEFTRQDAEEWMARMENTDPDRPKGPLWSEEQCLSVAASAGIDLHDIPGYVFWAAMNMEWSDGWRVASDFGVDQQQYYARQAEAFLRDKDAGGPEEKICAYYRYVAGASK